MGRAYDLPLSLEQVSTMSRLKAFADQEIGAAQERGHLHSVKAWTEVRDNLAQHLNAHAQMVVASQSSQPAGCLF